MQSLLDLLSWQLCLSLQICFSNKLDYWLGVATSVQCPKEITRAVHLKKSLPPLSHGFLGCSSMCVVDWHLGDFLGSTCKNMVGCMRTDDVWQKLLKLELVDHEILTQTLPHALGVFLARLCGVSIHQVRVIALCSHFGHIWFDGRNNLVAWQLLEPPGKLRTLSIEDPPQ